MHDREVLDAYLARALGIRVKNRIQDIDDQQYVLTVDYALKMLDIHERYHCGIPVIIEGETGVGKTSLVDMLSILWNRPWLDMWNYSKDCIIEEITKHVTGKVSFQVKFVYAYCEFLAFQLFMDQWNPPNKTKYLKHYIPYHQEMYQ